MGLLQWLFLKHACTHIQSLSSSSISRYLLFMNMGENFPLMFYIRWAQSYWLKARTMWDSNYNPKTLHMHLNECCNPFSIAYCNCFSMFLLKKYCYHRELCLTNSFVKWEKDAVANHDYFMMYSLMF